MPSEQNTDREKLARLLWETPLPTTAPEHYDLADAILASDWLSEHDERVRREAAAEQREKDAQIAASNLDRPWVASETPGDIARAIQAGGIDG